MLTPAQAEQSENLGCHMILSPIQHVFTRQLITWVDNFRTGTNESRGVEGGEDTALVGTPGWMVVAICRRM